MLPTRSFCGESHIEAIWELPSTIHKLEPLIKAVQQEEQTTTKDLESALKEEITRIRSETEAIVLPTVEKTIPTHSRPPPRWMNEQVS